MTALMYDQILDHVYLGSVIETPKVEKQELCYTWRWIDLDQWQLRHDNYRVCVEDETLMDGRCIFFEGLKCIDLLVTSDESRKSLRVSNGNKAKHTFTSLIYGQLEKNAKWTKVLMEYV